MAIRVKNKKRKSTIRSLSFLHKFIILVILLLILSGLRVYWKNGSNEQTLSGITPTNIYLVTPTPTLLPYKEPTEHAPQKTVVENGYAFIPELGIKFKVGSELNDLIYQVGIYGKDENVVTYVRFATQSLLTLDEGCGPYHAPLGTISRSRKDPYWETIGGGPEKHEVIKIGNYYYYYVHPQAACVTEEAGKLEAEQIALLRAAFQTIEPL